MMMKEYYRNLLIISVLFCFTTLAKATGNLPDPTRPANYTSNEKTLMNSEQKTIEQSGEKMAEQIPDLQLQAIKISRTASMAIINGQVVFPGQTVSTATLLKVNPDSVLMDYNGRPLIVSLLPDSIKKRTSK